MVEGSPALVNRDISVLGQTPKVRASPRTVGVVGATRTIASTKSRPSRWSSGSRSSRGPRIRAAWLVVGSDTRWRSRPQPLRLASEYAHIADHYARRHHLGHYEVIPISGASEGFVPEDADLLIEGAETGKTIVANRLKVIDTLFESTTCLIANREALVGPRGNALRGLIEGLKRAAPVAASQCAAAPPSRPAAGPSGASQGA